MRLRDDWLRKEVILLHHLLLLIGCTICTALAAIVLIQLTDPQRRRKEHQFHRMNRPSLILKKSFFFSIDYQLLFLK